MSFRRRRQKEFDSDSDEEQQPGYGGELYFDLIMEVISDELDDVLKDTTDRTLARLYWMANDYHIVCTDIGKGIFYIYDDETTLYRQIEPIEFECYVSESLDIYFQAQRSDLEEIKADTAIKFPPDLGNKTKTKELEDFAKLINSKIQKYTDIIRIVGNSSTCCGIAKRARKLLFKRKFDDIFDITRDVVNFKNGIISLRDGSFRERTPNDYFTICLDYDYSSECDLKIYDQINKWILDICNSNEEHKKSYLNYFGYCLTGEINMQKALWSIGHLAANGKSTFIAMFTSMFESYCQEMDPETFNKGYQGVFKQLSDLRGKRFAYVNELGKERLDIELLKRLIGDPKIGGNKKMYGTTESFPLYTKFVFTSNKNSNFGTDEGMRRRGYYFSHTNKFVSRRDYDIAMEEHNKDPINIPLPEQRGILLGDKNILSHFNGDIYKLSLFQILLPHAINYYTKGTIEKDEVMEDKWLELCMENDKMKLFIEEYFKPQVEGTICKDDFLKLYQEYYQLTKIQWQNLSNDVKRCGYKYDRQKQKNNKTGLIIGLTENDKLLAKIQSDKDSSDIKKSYKKDMRIQDGKFDESEE